MLSTFLKEYNLQLICLFWVILLTSTSLTFYLHQRQLQNLCLPGRLENIHPDWVVCSLPDQTVWIVTK